MAAHTHGPWEVVGPYFDVYQSDSSEYICQSSKSQGDRREANARLVAAAPEMLEALEGVMSGYKMTAANPPEWFERVREAAAKARGGA